MEAFDDGGCVYEVSSTEDAYEMRVELGDLYPGGPMHVGRTLQKKLNKRKKEKEKSCMGRKERRERVRMAGADAI